MFQKKIILVVLFFICMPLLQAQQRTLNNFYKHSQSTLKKYPLHTLLGLDPEHDQSRVERISRSLKKDSSNALFLMLDSLSMEEASLLANDWKGTLLCIHFSKPLEQEVALTLFSCSAVSLYLNGSFELNPALATNLANGERSVLGLNGLTTLDSQTARALEKCSTGSILYLNGLTALEPEVAEALAFWKGHTLYLNGLTRLNLTTAKNLATWNGSILYLNNITLLTTEEAQVLSQWEGAHLSLENLRNLSFEVVQQLRSFKRTLVINTQRQKELVLLSQESLKNLPPEERLHLYPQETDWQKYEISSLFRNIKEKPEEHLFLDSIHSIDPQDLFLLTLWRISSLSLNGLTQLNADMAQFLKNWR